MRCNKECFNLEPDPSKRRPIPGHICLLNESVFLETLINFSQRVLGPHMRGWLLEAYYDTKRLWQEPWGEPDPQHDAIKVLDELAKGFFGALQVTARLRKSNGAPSYLILLDPNAPLESKATNMAIGNEKDFGFLKVSIPEEYRSLVSANALSWSQSNTGSCIDNNAGYIENVACRKGFLEIDRIIRFDWRWYEMKSEETYDIFVLFSKDHKSVFQNYGFASREMCFKMACAFLHGVSKFLLVNSKYPKRHNVRRGYDLKKDYSDIWDQKETNMKLILDVTDNSKRPTNHEAIIAEHWAKQPHNSLLKLLIPLVTQYRKEYLDTLKDAYQKTGFSGSEKLFSLLFLYKLKDGWVWLLDGEQEAKLATLATIGSYGISPETFATVWKDFRFRCSGIVTHMERKALLADSVKAPAEELVCAEAGYYVDSREADLAEYFTKIEDVIPGVEDSSFFYFRLTSFESKKGSREGILPIGAMVAVFRLPNKHDKLSYLDPLQYQAIFRRLAANWRIKLNTLSQLREQVEDVVTEAVKKKEQEERTAAIAGFCHQVGHVIGGKSNLPLYDFKLEEVCNKGLLSTKEMLARSAQIRYAALLPRAYEDALDLPEAVLARWSSKNSLQRFILAKDLFNDVWFNLAKPILEYIKDLQDSESTFRCSGRELKLEGLALVPDGIRVPNLEVVHIALFESLWNAFEHGDFGDPSNPAIVYVKFHKTKYELVIEVLNHWNPKTVTPQADDRGQGIIHARIMIENLRRAGQVHPNNIEFNRASYCHFDSNPEGKEWVTRLTLGRG